MISDDSRHSAVIALTSGVFVLVYAYIGLNRLVMSPTIFSGDALLWYLSGSSAGLSNYPAFLNFEALRPALNFGFALMTCLEVTSPFVLLWNRWRVVWLISMTVFHLLIAVLMNILFWENLVLLWVIFGASGNGARIEGRSEASVEATRGAKHS